MNHFKLPAIVLILVAGLTAPSFALTDTLKFQWPNPPFDNRLNDKRINGTFCEFRNTLGSRASLKSYC